MLEPEDHGKKYRALGRWGRQTVLYSVVVKHERIDKDLLECGGIKKCVTLIQSSRIQALCCWQEHQRGLDEPPEGG